MGTILKHLYQSKINLEQLNQIGGRSGVASAARKAWRWPPETRQRLLVADKVRRDPTGARDPTQWAAEAARKRRGPRRGALWRPGLLA
jgi:hypothetical protein